MIRRYVRTAGTLSAALWRGCLWVTLFAAAAAGQDTQGLPVRWRDGALEIGRGEGVRRFTPVFTVLYSGRDPQLALRPAGIPGVAYNVPTWVSYRGQLSGLAERQADPAMAGDGFDSSILEGGTRGRTAEVFRAAAVYRLEATGAVCRDDTVFLRFPPLKAGTLSAYIVPGAAPYPQLHFQFRARLAGWFSVGYSGAPAFDISRIRELFQPLIWQERRVPDKAYMTLAFRCPVPATLVDDGSRTTGVVADPREYPFDPLPLAANSRFGLTLRGEAARLQPRLYHPVLGGAGSRLAAGDKVSFSLYLFAADRDITHSFETLAWRLYGFGDYRHNDISTLNRTLDRIAAYSLSRYAWFIDSLKGCAYSTDVPGAVKNVSSLNPLELALVMDDSAFLNRRAVPVMEYMLSREKFLFSLDSTQKIQHPSRALDGPVAPLSELAALYGIFHRSNPFFLRLAEGALCHPRVRNLDVEQPQDSWWNLLYLYRATGRDSLLQAARRGADRYLARRVATRATSFDDPYSDGMFFWTGFTNRWIELLQLYETTRDVRYLHAARDGARHFAMFTWMSPAIPDSFVVVNPGGWAPVYGYLKNKGHHPMRYPEERAPAWRLSAMGLTSESSATSSGHRAIFMAHFAPWMLRIGYYCRDTFLMDIAKAAVIGRYRNFPGYHINTQRTTAYEKTDFPYHDFMDQSVSSFHYNHIMPMASMLIDYLVSDVFVRSRGRIDFPRAYIEGYAYLKSGFYGSRPGRWYGSDSVWLWMPPGLLAVSDVELNYLTARKGDTLFVAFTNQSSHRVTADVCWDTALVSRSAAVRLTYREGGRTRTDTLPPYSRSWPVGVAPGSLTLVTIAGVRAKPRIQQRLLSPAAAWHHDYREIAFGRARAMVYSLGASGRRCYIYLRDDDSRYRQVSVIYRDGSGNTRKVTDSTYPFEFSLPVDAGQAVFSFHLEGMGADGTYQRGGVVTLSAE